MLFLEFHQGKRWKYYKHPFFNYIKHNFDEKKIIFKKIFIIKANPPTAVPAFDIH